MSLTAWAEHYLSLSGPPICVTPPPPKPRTRHTVSLSPQTCPHVHFCVCRQPSFPGLVFPDRVSLYSPGFFETQRSSSLWFLSAHWPVSPSSSSPLTPIWLKKEVPLLKSGLCTEGQHPWPALSAGVGFTVLSSIVHSSGNGQWSCTRISPWM